MSYIFTAAPLDSNDEVCTGSCNWRFAVCFWKAPTSQITNKLQPPVVKNCPRIVSVSYATPACYIVPTSFENPPGHCHVSEKPIKCVYVLATRLKRLADVCIDIKVNRLWARWGEIVRCFRRYFLLDRGRVYGRYWFVPRKPEDMKESGSTKGVLSLRFYKRVYIQFWCPLLNCAQWRCTESVDRCMIVVQPFVFVRFFSEGSDHEEDYWVEKGDFRMHFLDLEITLWCIRRLFSFIRANQGKIYTT